jgi:flagellar hook-length control protein FliK
MGARALQAFSTRDGLASDLTIDLAPRQSAGGEAGFAGALGQIGRAPEVAPPQIPGNLPVLLAAATGSLGEDLSQRILWLSSHNLRSAEIRLDPPELGPLQVQVQHHRDGTSVHFTTSSAAVKDVVEANLPRLRELLEGSGLSLVDVNVAQQQQRGAPGQREAFDSSASTSRGLLATLQQSEVTPSVRRSIGLVDDYA